MTNILWQALKHSPTVLGATLLVANGAFAAQTPTLESTTTPDFALTAETVTDISATAQPQPEILAQFSEVPSVSQLSEPGTATTMGQVTSVSQLSDVRPTDWAFQALQSLVERYGCIAGYPDGTYRGQRALTRFEFAAGLNACLDRVNELIASAVANAVTREDLAILQRLQEEFAAELATLRGRVDALEARTTELEYNQFSTTTKLNGEVIFQLADTWGNSVGDEGHDNDDDDTQSIFAYRARLNFDTSFTGKDLLRTRLQVRNIDTFDSSSGTRMTRLGTAGDSEGQFELDDLYYRFPIGKGRMFIVANSTDYDNIGTVLSPLSSSGSGAISRFGRRNPVLFRGPENAGLGIQYPLGDSFRFNAAYLAGNPGDPTEGNGIFNGSFGALAQLVWKPNADFGFSIGYNHKYFSTGDVNVTSSTGSFNAQRPFGNNATTAENVAAEMNWKISDGFELGGWYGYTWADQKRGGNDSATIQNWAVTLGFPNLLAEGNLGGIIVGMPPKVTDHDDDGFEDEDSALHIEAFYRWQVTDFIGITPGFFVITNPEHDEDNDAIWVGTIRTTFSF